MGEHMRAVRLTGRQSPPEVCDVLVPARGPIARAGSIRLEVEQVPLSDVEAAYGRLERGEVRGRVVAVPDQGAAA